MKRLVTILAVLGLLLAACSSDAETEAGGGELSSDVAGGDGADGTDSSPDSADAAGEGDTSDGADSGEGGSDDAATSSDGGETDAAASSAPETLRSAVLGRSLDRTASQGSGRFEGSINIVGRPDSELPGDIVMTFSGAFDIAADATQMTIDMSGLLAAMAAAAADPDAAAMGDMFSAMFEEPMEVITIGDKSWIRSGLLAMFGVEDKWLEASAEAGASMGGAGFGGGNAPVDLLEELADADATIENLGEEEIRGVSTTHHRAELDFDALAATMSSEERASFQESFGGADVTGTFVLDVWIDGDGLPHRFELSISDLAQTGDTADLESMVFRYELWDHGAAVEISPPPADQIITEEELGLRLEDLGSLGG